MNEKKRNDHERTDWNLTWVIVSFALLVAFAAVLLAGSWWVFRQFYATAASRQMGTVRGTEDLPPEPRLQVSPEREWQEMFTHEQQVLNSYGWIDRSQGVVRIPVQRAMELLAQRGLPAEGAGGNAK